MRSYIGRGVDVLLHRVLTGDTRRQRRAPTSTSARAMFFSITTPRTTAARRRFIPACVEGIEHARRLGLKLCCVTNKPQAFSDALLAQVGLDRYLEFVHRRRCVAERQARSDAVAARGVSSRRRAARVPDDRRFVERRPCSAGGRHAGRAGRLWLQDASTRSIATRSSLDCGRDRRIDRRCRSSRSMRDRALSSRYAATRSSAREMPFARARLATTGIARIPADRRCPQERGAVAYTPFSSALFMQ